MSRFVVEDENIKKVLEKLGYEDIKAVGDWASVIEYAKSTGSDFLVVDYNTNWDKKLKQVEKEIKRKDALIFCGLKDDKFINEIFSRFEIEDFLLRGLCQKDFHDCFDWDKLGEIFHSTDDLKVLFNELLIFANCLRTNKLKLTYGSAKCVLWVFFHRYYGDKHKPFNFNDFFETILDTISNPEKFFKELKEQLP